MRLLLGVSLVFTALASQALAEESSAPPPAAHDPKQVICVRKATSTGTIMVPHAECHTRAEWLEKKDPAYDTGASEVKGYDNFDRSQLLARGVPGGT